MDERWKETESVFVLDVSRCLLGQQVHIAGIIEKRDKFGDGVYGVWLRDITGTVLIIIEPATDPICEEWNPNSVWVGTRVRIAGRIGENSKKIRVLNRITSIEVLGSPENKALSELDAEMREYASSMLMSRMCRGVSEFLRRNRFTEFVSRVISNHWPAEGLEPMQVVYPGFGSPAILIPSPSSQIVEFLTTTLIPRAFTVSTSFTQSYRFSHSASETLVIVAKATDLDLDGYIDLLKEVSERILKQLVDEGRSFSVLNGIWPHLIDGVDRNDIQLTNDLNLIQFSANIPVIGKNWDTHIDSVLQLLDRDKNILMEGTREQLADRVWISSFTVYPSQFLGLIERAPSRLLQNLMRLYDGRRY